MLNSMIENENKSFTNTLILFLRLKSDIVSKFFQYNENKSLTSKASSADFVRSQTSVSY